MMTKFSTYRGFAIEWIDHLECYRVYDLKRPNWTIAYAEDPVDKIKREIDKQIFKEER